MFAITNPYLLSKARKLCSLTFVIALASVGVVAKATSNPERVIQVLNPKSDALKVLLTGGEAAGIEAGDTLLTVRHISKSADAQGIITGRLKVIETFPDRALASVIADGSEAAAAAFPKFPNIMAGDLIRRETVELGYKTQIFPELVLTYQSLFVDPKSSPSTFELSVEGAQELEKVAAEFAKAQVETLLVEAHTDSIGDADANQIESYQRALTIRQLLITQYGFDASRVVAIGQGENQTLDDDFVPGHRESSRRIAIRVMH